ncbi:hypothetical protein UA08_04682 [Talaromyces atroroseus]|uniref:Inhibitor of growth protein N-terminal histone-binding domain-containing protein n=1 Tax=Talaromyces atroroseus TaxID=1441469 RepID=A0A225AZF8_TALAT|nr:hypothetical protein UA08_04682 [Talaromyces atroroseus]OKL59865.1 hypothetical protein UA08_04682 [Talaromyces atroroseus]
MASAATNGANAVSQASGSRNAVRQTRTNPSRVSKTAARSFPYYGQQSASDAPQAANVPHGLYPALTHFTDAITALPREFRRHNSLLKEVDAKAWALEDNLHQLLLTASDSRPVPYPPNPAPIVDGVVRDYGNDPQNAESQESKHRRQLFDRIRRTLSDLMLTADEKNHVLTNANEELDHQLYRLNSIYPYISTEVSEEARLGSLTHWAYSNRAAAKAAAKTTTNERPRREAASATSHLVQALQEADAAAHRSEVRREANRRQRRGHADSDFDETRTTTHRKGGAARSRAVAGDSADSGAATVSVTKRRKVEKPASIQTGSAAMERSASGITNNGRTTSKDSAGAEVKKRTRAPNAVSAAGRKRNNTMTSNVEPPSVSSPPIVGTFNPPRSAPSPGPRPQSSRAQQPATQANSRQRPPSSSNRVNNSSTLPGPGDIPLGVTSNQTSVADKAVDSKVFNTPTEDSNLKERTPQTLPGDARPLDTKKDSSDTKSNLLVDKDERPEVKAIDTTHATEQMSPALSTIGPAKGRSSKTSTPVMSTFAEAQTRVRSSRNNPEAATKRSHKKSGSVSTAYKPKIAVREEEESSREGDDEDDESEPRYCYCNQLTGGHETRLPQKSYLTATAAIRRPLRRAPSLLITAA